MSLRVATQLLPIIYEQLYRVAVEHAPSRLEGIDDYASVTFREQSGIASPFINGDIEWTIYYERNETNGTQTARVRAVLDGKVIFH
jgi:hypothetical protein